MAMIVGRVKRGKLYRMGGGVVVAVAGACLLVVAPVSASPSNTGGPAQQCQQNDNFGFATTGECASWLVSNGEAATRAATADLPAGRTPR